MRLSHQPDGYRCPFCRVAAGEDLRGDFTKQTDVIFRDGTLTAFISSAWWPANPGNVLIVPNNHYENIYDIPNPVLAAIQIQGKRIALALAALRLRWHVVPPAQWTRQRPGGLALPSPRVPPLPGRRSVYVRTMERRDTTPTEREPYAMKLRHYLAQLEHAVQEGRSA